ncbi:hypothetical protein NIES4106_14290 [Fischerella sp. NIES-4106]|jgi:hypothetical protein|nr:hypothetical protein NIES4106_14290 [Fischerella sp. NIES-4106]
MCVSPRIIYIIKLKIFTLLHILQKNLGESNRGETEVRITIRDRDIDTRSREMKIRVLIFIRH